MTPLELGPNLLRRFYRGGPRIAAFRGLGTAGDGTPEDWVGSTTSAWAEPELGPSRLPDGRLLADALAAEPDAFFEPEHLERHGAEPGLLLKLLDAGERLPVHLHPDDEFARERLAAPRGKTEAWYILDAEPGAFVGVGFSRDVSAVELAAWFDEQDVDEMLAATNRVDVAAGDTVFVPAGLPHAIGAGILLVELQQPADLSLLLETHGTTPAEALLGLEPGQALAAVRRTAVAADELERLRSRRGAALFPAEADAFFRAELVGNGAALDAGFSFLVGTGGSGRLVSEHGAPLELRRGSTVLVPYGAGACRVEGAVRAVRCRPPA